MLKTLALLPCLALPAFAQQTSPGTVPPIKFPVPTTVVRPPMHPQETDVCPLGIAAKARKTPQSISVRSTADATQRTEDTAPNINFKTALHVRVNALDAKAMSHVTVTVLYSEVAHGLVPVNGSAGVPGQKTFELVAAELATLNRDLFLAGNVDIERIQVLKVAYTDGTEWQAKQSTSCSINVDHILLVDTQ